MTIRLLTQEDYIELWRRLFPPSYTVPIEMEAEGQGFDKEQAQAAIFAAVSQAIIEQTQAYYLKPHSLAVAPIASGPTFASGNVNILRTGNVDFAAPLLAGTRVLATQLGSYGQEIEIGEFQTTVREDFEPGETEKSVFVQAVLSGYALNVPAGKVTAFSVRGQSTITNADVTGGNVAVVQSFNRAAGGQDVFSPDMVGQYIRFTNVPVVPPGPRLIVSDLVVTSGSTQTTTVQFDPMLEDPSSPGDPLPDVFKLPATLLSTNTEPFAITGGEVLNLVMDGRVGVAVVFGVADTTAAAVVIAINAAFGTALQPQPATEESGAVRLTGTVTGIEGTIEVLAGTAAPILGYPVATVTGTDGATIEVEEFADVGFSVEQPDALDGGQTGYLDAIGFDRNTPRQTGEGDEQYRDRLCNLSDVISPAAIIRICESIMSPLGLGCILKETRCIEPNPTDPRFGCISGFIFDSVTDAHYANKAPAILNAYDLDNDFAQDRGFVWLDLLESVRFFLLCVGQGNEGEFGFGYDDSGTNPYDADVFNFYDGSALGYSQAVGQLWQAINASRAAGVAFEIQRVPGLTA